MNVTKRKVGLPIGRTAVIGFQIEALRTECCKAADSLMRQKLLDEAELEECAKLDDALAEAHRLIKATLSRIVISRLRRKSRSRQM